MFARTMILALCLALYSDGARADEKPRDKTKGLSAEECEKLVEQLVNPEKKPFERFVLDLEDAGVSAPELWKSFEQVSEAYDRLGQNIEVALPVLMKHVN